MAQRVTSVINTQRGFAGLRGMMPGGGGHLGVHFGGKGAADVGGAVVQHDVEEAAGGFFAEAFAAALAGDVLGDGERAADRLDRHQVDADDARRHRHVLRTYLQRAAHQGTSRRIKATLGWEGRAGARSGTCEQCRGVGQGWQGGGSEIRGWWGGDMHGCRWNVTGADRGERREHDEKA